VGSLPAGPSKDCSGAAEEGGGHEVQGSILTFFLLLFAGVGILLNLTLVLLVRYNTQKRGKVPSKTTPGTATVAASRI
jgi:hypothetical protein